MRFSVNNAAPSLGEVSWELKDLQERKQDGR